MENLSTMFWESKEFLVLKNICVNYPYFVSELVVTPVCHQRASNMLIFWQIISTDKISQVKLVIVNMVYSIIY